MLEKDRFGKDFPLRYHEILNILYVYCTRRSKYTRLIDKFAEFSSQEFISLSNDMKTCIQVKRLIISFIIRYVNRVFILGIINGIHSNHCLVT